MSGKQQVSPPAGGAGELALELVRSAARLTRAASKIPGVTYSSIAWRVLSDLERDGQARVTDLATAQRVAQPTMTTLLQRLGGEGWVSRIPDPADGRASLVGITDEGARALAAYRAGAAELIAPQLATLSEADTNALARAAALMHRIADAI
ncbi:MarR family winged helix-turn-helix transcriptional regulator [Leucobacter komagatae]|uniref:MarR family winged helix-turn-helix transcriptional regulator n=1 Tax=Leucobacter komagatae TaxID=55969 RepID=UPI0005ACCF8F|nr:MarR family transcriptional regulator [Leucobacter komagatae]